MHYQRQIVKLQRNSKFTVANPLLSVTAIPIRENLGFYVNLCDVATKYIYIATFQLLANIVRLIHCIPCNFLDGHFLFTLWLVNSFANSWNS